MSNFTFPSVSTYSSPSGKGLLKLAFNVERLPQRMWTNALTPQLEAGHEGCGEWQRKGLATGWLEREAAKAQKSAEILVRRDNME